MQKYCESEYQKEYKEIMAVYGEQIKPFKNPFLIAFIVITAIIGTFLLILLLSRNRLIRRSFVRRIFLGTGNYYYATIKGLVLFFYFIPGTYVIRLRKIIKHKDRRLKDLEEKKTEAVSMGFYDADL